MEKIFDLLNLKKEKGLIKLFLQSKEIFNSNALALKLLDIIGEEAYNYEEEEYDIY